MESLGQFSLFTRLGKPLTCGAWWLSTETDWDFAAGWEAASGTDARPSIRDSIEYALIGRKRWQWLSVRGEAAVSLDDARQRVTADAESEFAFALILSMPGDAGTVTGFCYARRVWTGTICLEFLGMSATPEITGGGSLLMFLLSRIADDFQCRELWGECTRASHGFYRRLGERLHAETNPKGDDRFSFGADELEAMRAILDSLQR